MAGSSASRATTSAGRGGVDGQVGRADAACEVGERRDEDGRREVARRRDRHRELQRRRRLEPGRGHGNAVARHADRVGRASPMTMPRRQSVVDVMNALTRAGCRRRAAAGETHEAGCRATRHARDASRYPTASMRAATQAASRRRCRRHRVWPARASTSNRERAAGRPRLAARRNVLHASGRAAPVATAGSTPSTRAAFAAEMPASAFADSVTTPSGSTYARRKSRIVDPVATRRSSAARPAGSR